MLGGGMRVIWTCAALLAVAAAGPLQRFLREAEDYQSLDLSAYANFTANEVCFSDNEVFQKGDVMPNPGPCEECRCEPPSIVCNMLKCPVNNNGCRTIQRVNHCCPDYNCECDYNGQLYNDGERVDVPEDPCQVCYCKGGEVMCTSVTCYHRDDCEPQTVPGQCCPKYENCPVRDKGTSNTETNRTTNHLPKREMQPWLLTKSAPQPSSNPTPKVTEDTTREDGNIIIVSDWLTERKTTSVDPAYEGSLVYEGSLHRTADPVFIMNPELTTTVEEHNFNTRQTDGSVVVRKSETITPPDEVIFTRVDMLRQPQQKHNQEPSHIPTDLENTDPTTMPYNIYNPSTISNSHVGYHSVTSDQVSSIEPNKLNKDEPLEVVSHSGEKEDKENSPSSEHTNLSSTKFEYPDKETLNGYSEIKDESLGNGNVESNIQLANKENQVIENATNDPFSDEDLINLSEHSSVSSINPETETKFESEGEPNADTSEEITLEHLFRFDKSEMGEVVNRNFTVRNETVESFLKLEESITNKDNPNNKLTDTDETTQLINEKLDENTSKGDFEIQSEEIGLEESIGDTVIENNTTITDNSIEDESTTPYITEDHISVLNFELAEERQADVEIESVTLNNPSLTTDENGGTSTESPVKTTLAHRTEPGMSVVHSKENTQLDLKHENDQKSALNVEEKGKISIQEVLISSTMADSDDTTTKPLKVVMENNSSKEKDKEEFENSSGLSTEFSINKPIKLQVNTKTKISQAPPVLELNSHVPFLQIGGHANIDYSSDTPEHIITTIAPELEKSNDFINLNQVKTETTVDNLLSTGSEDEFINELSTNAPIEEYGPIINNKINPMKFQEDIQDSDGDIPTSHIPLTPEDLKVLAEYLINEKIKPVITINNASSYPNQWLKGNLTSGGNMESILSAANVSIGIINQTSSKNIVTHENLSKSGEKVPIDRFEKDSLFKGNSILQSQFNKTANFHNKNSYDLSQEKSFPKSLQNSKTDHFETSTDHTTLTDMFTVTSIVTDSSIKIQSKKQHNGDENSQNNPMSITKSGQTGDPMKVLKDSTTQSILSLPEYETEGISDLPDTIQLKERQSSDADEVKHQELSLNTEKYSRTKNKEISDLTTTKDVLYSSTLLP